MRRRALLTGGIAAVVTGLAGCSATPDRVDEEAEPAQVAPEALDATGYEHETTEELPVEDSVTVAGETIEYEVVNWSSTYSGSSDVVDVDLGLPVPGVVFLTTPDVRVGGQVANPLGRADADELARELAAALDVGLDSLEETGELRVDIAGETTTTLTQFRSDVQVAGEQFPVTQYAGRVVVEDDWVVIGAVHHAEADERDAIARLAEGVVYPADVGS